MVGWLTDVKGRMEEGYREIIQACQLVTSFLQGATQLWERWGRETENKPTGYKIIPCLTRSH